MRFEIIDHGVENSQYFQGCGVVFSNFDDVVTGIGSSFKEALEDALESMAQTGVTIPQALEDEANEASDDTTVEEDSEDCYHYVSIRWSATQYEVIVGNIGTVYSGASEEEARTHFAEYLKQSKDNCGRASGEPVTLMQDGEPIEEYAGTNESEESN